MASICRSAAMFAARFVSVRSKIQLLKPQPSIRAAVLFPRSLSSALGGVESRRPLHSAIASARLISNIAVDAAYWSCFSRDLALPR
ncbi:hypothetical protein AXF42_Ash012150 [Apostasia shenzhenica]|uniref:Uncharacterized protein n=1 Tax=Apostasia shenzhenica TaxID=1088818 RepID=A0A2I0B447_9ASPA|nr:hypothetical protein AXF42_Ash012150 [Apostasia shenzhenica]